MDATNYDSLRASVTGTGELFITTEGLLNYFTENELSALLENVRRLLAEFGMRRLPDAARSTSPGAWLPAR